MNKQQLASRIWASANKMRSKIEANDYKDYILGFIFYKFVSEKEEKYLLDDGWSKDDLKTLNEENADTVSYVQKNIGYFISYKNLFSSWLYMGSDFDVSNVKDALCSFDRLIDPSYKKVFDGVFKTLDTGISNLGDSSGAQTKAIRGLIDLIKDIPMDGKQDYDVLGFIYEYLISNFAANAGKKAGEFYTPHEVSLLISEIVANHLKNRQEIEIYDPTSGSGSLLINIGKSVARHMTNSNNIKYYAQELKENTYNLTRMNLIMRGILPSNIITRCDDTLDKDWPFFDENHSYSPLYVDAVVSNPPYSQPWDPTSHEADVRYSRFGLAPKSKADYAFLLHDLYHVKPDGIMAIVLPHGVLFRGGEEEKIRKNLVEFNNIDTIIGLPANIFFGTGIPTIIMVLKQQRETNDIFFIDASKHFTKVGKNNVLQQSDIKRIVDAVVSRETTPKFSRLVSKDEIRKNEYNLNIPRYVDSSEKAETFDIYATMFGGIPNKEIDEFNEFFTLFPSLRENLFINLPNKLYCELVSSDIASAIHSNACVCSFKDKYKTAFRGFDLYLKERLIDGIDTAMPYMEETLIWHELSKRLEPFLIIDKYLLYQYLDDSFKTILQDIEVIQTEGIESCRLVDPNMVVKKKDGKETEIQEGWVGHIFSFELIENQYLSEELEKIHQLESNLSKIESRLEEILESMSEEDKAQNFVTEERESFVPKEVAAFVKNAKKNKITIEDGSIEKAMIEVEELLGKAKNLKKKQKISETRLAEKAKITIESLTDEQIKEMLFKKWVSPLVERILTIPDSLFAELTQKIKTLYRKYETTMVELSSQIDESEKKLSEMLDDLVGEEFDIKGIAELKKLLDGDKNE